MMKIGSIPRFWADTAASSKAVVLPVSECPRSRTIWPKGIPGIESMSEKVLYKGIHYCSLNLTFELRPFLSLKL